MVRDNVVGSTRCSNSTVFSKAFTTLTSAAGLCYFSLGGGMAILVLGVHRIESLCVRVMELDRY